LDLQELQKQAKKSAWPPTATVRPSNVLKVDSFVYQQLCGQTEAMLFPIGIVVDLVADDLVDQILRVCTLDSVSMGVSAICHQQEP